MRKLLAFATFALLLVLPTSTSIQAHPGRTDSNGCHTCRTNCEKWGVIDNGYAIFYNSAFDQICRDGGFSKKSFLSWADKKCLIQTQGGQQTKVKKINGTAARCVWLKIDESMDNDGFKPVDEGQEELPFK